MTVFMRSPTWISGAFGDAAMIALGLDPNDIQCKSPCIGTLLVCGLKIDMRHIRQSRLRSGRRWLAILSHTSR